ncbi:MAG: indole-3-glycerol phosphate synthase TrpC [Ruminococcus sp.]|nr:indole-3-glycerol phosphate synthase TrpC [Ruminococcus sp.]
MILDEIVKVRLGQLEREKSKISESEIKALAERSTKPIYDLTKSLKSDRLRLICEVKKASPSKGLIAANFDPLSTARQYEAAGAAAISCLTEEHYFQGSNEYLSEIAKCVKIPVLRKDFIVDEYQIYHARALGASAVLLIAAVLDDEKLREYLNITHSLGMKALLEVHDESELERALSLDAEIIGVNNRNLKTFEVTLDTTKALMSKIGSDKVRVSESGIKTNEDMRSLRSYGADAVLIGETLMRSGDIGSTFKALTEGV